MSRRSRDASADDVVALTKSLQIARQRLTRGVSCNSQLSSSSSEVQLACAATVADWAPPPQKRRSLVARLSLLTMVKDAHLLLREWIPYHFQLGVAHAYVVNNDCGDAASWYGSCEGLRPYVDAGLVTLLDPAFRCRRIGRAVLLGALSDELMRSTNSSRSEHEWLLEIDPDEYLVLPPASRVPDFLRVHARNSDSVPLPWRIFGTSFRRNATVLGTIGANYRLRLPLALTFDGVVRLVESQKARDQVHPFLFKEAVRLAALGDIERCRDAHGAHGHLCGRNLDWVAARKRPPAESTPRVSEEQAPLPAAVAAAFIHHYTFLSADEWERKKLRGRPRKGMKFSRRRGSVDPLFSAVYDTTLTDRLKILADDAASWSANPRLARQCASSLQHADQHFADLTDESTLLALARTARENARAQTARGGAAARHAAAHWFLERWAQSGHTSRAPVAAARALGSRANESSQAAQWLLERWNGTLSDADRTSATNVIASVVGAYPEECDRPGHKRAAECAGWAGAVQERV